MVSSCILIVNSDQVVALRALSFSVVLIYIHFVSSFLQPNLPETLFVLNIDRCFLSFPLFPKKDL